MHHLKLFLTFGFAAVAVAAFAAPASATTPTSPKGTVYTGIIEGKSENLSLDSGFVTVTCGKSTAKAQVVQHGSSITAGSQLSNLTFSECNFAVHARKGGTTEVHSKGTFTSSGMDVVVTSSVGECIFTTTNTDLGTATSSEETGGNSVIDFNSAKIPRTAGNFLCGSYGTLTGSYTITTPSTVFLD